MSSFQSSDNPDLWRSPDRAMLFLLELIMSNRSPICLNSNGLLSFCLQSAGGILDLIFFELSLPRCKDTLNHFINRHVILNGRRSQRNCSPINMTNINVEI